MRRTSSEDKKAKARARYWAKREQLLPMYRERYAATGAAAYQEAKKDPAFIAKRREAWASYYAKKKQELCLKKAKRKRYGLTHAAYMALVTAQGGKCASCGDVPPAFPDRKRLVIDHDHETGAVRGLLCGGCNIGIGHLGDSPEKLRQAAMYLEARKAQAA